MNTDQQIIQANYWENFKFAKELALIYPIDHPKRVKVEKELNEMAEKLNK